MISPGIKAWCYWCKVRFKAGDNITKNKGLLVEILTLKCDKLWFYFCAVALNVLNDTTLDVRDNMTDVKINL